MTEVVLPEEDLGFGLIGGKAHVARQSFAIDFDVAAIHTFERHPSMSTVYQLETGAFALVVGTAVVENTMRIADGGTPRGLVDDAERLAKGDVLRAIGTGFVHGKVVKLGIAAVLSVLVEGKKRMEIADNSLENFIKEVDSIIVIQNQNLFNVATENTTLPEAFKMADNVLYSGVRSITDLMMMPGLINLDFADVKNIMEDKGKAIMGTGEAEGKGRAKEAANQALSNPLLDECSLHGAKGVLINITGSKDITLPELDEAANIIKEEVGDDANIIFGSSYDDNLQGKIRVSIVVTGINGNDERKPEPVKVAQPQPSLIEQSYDDLTVVPTVNVEPENSFTSSLDLENPFELDETFSDDPLPDDEADVTKFADDDFATLDKSDELPEVPQASALFNAIRNSDGKTEETEQAIEELSSAALQDDFFSSKTDIENTNDDDLVLFTDNDTSIFKDTPLTTDTEEKAEPVAEVHEEESKPNFFSRIGFGSRKKNREEAENNNDEHLVAEKTGTDDEFDLSAEELDIPAFLRR